MTIAVTLTGLGGVLSSIPGATKLHPGYRKREVARVTRAQPTSMPATPVYSRHSYTNQILGASCRRLN